jgi:hypothetical protein
MHDVQQPGHLERLFRSTGRIKGRNTMTRKSVYVSALRIALVLAVSGGGMLGIGMFRSSTVKNSKWLRAKNQYLSQLREGLAEISFVPSGAGKGEVGASVDSAAAFIESRSGIVLTQELRSSIAEMEQQAMSDVSSFTLSDVKETLTPWLGERLSTLSDDEFDHAIETLRGFNAPDLPGHPVGDRDWVHLRASALIQVDRVIPQARKLREGLAAGDADTQVLVGGFISSEVESKAMNLSHGLSGISAEGIQAGKHGDLRFTPLQVVLIAYSVVSDDPLTRSQLNLRRAMKQKQASYVSTADHYPSPESHQAYGVNGYLHSSPVDLFFGADQVRSLLERMAQRRSA